MTNPPGEGQPPENPNENQGRSGSWQQPPGPSGYGQPQHGQPQLGQPQHGQPQYGQQYPYQPPVRYAPDHPRSTTVLVLGILGLVVCAPLAPFAWVMGRSALREIDASNGGYGGRGAANAGYILGIIGTVLLVFGILIVLFAIVLAGLGAMSSAP
jgi:hypothetical protein